MRWLAALASAGCSFEPGVFPRDDAAGSGTGNADSGATDVAQPDAFACSADDLFCFGNTAAMICNGGCWATCTSFVAVPNQPTAASICTNWGGKLAPIRDGDDQACVSQALFPAQASWIGFEQATTATQVAAGWSFNSDGITVTSPGWGAGQPDDGDTAENASENCASMNTSGDWHDTSCGHDGLYRFSCRKN